MKFFLIAIFCGICFQNISAQESKTDGAKFGFKGGVNFSNLYTQNVTDNNVLTGFNIGLFAKVPVTNFFAIQPEFIYTTKGAMLTYNNYFVNGTAKYNLNYIEIPILAVINLTHNFSIHAGPYISFLTNGKVVNNSSTNIFDFEKSINNDDYNRVDYGLAGGAAVDIDNFNIGVRYNYGLQKVGKEKNYNGTYYTFPDGKNSVISLYASISIN